MKISFETLDRHNILFNGQIPSWAFWLKTDDDDDSNTITFKNASVHLMITENTHVNKLLKDVFLRVLVREWYHYNLFPRGDILRLKDYYEKFRYKD